MAKYLVHGSYSPEGAKGLLKDGGTKRVAAVTAAVEALGGKVECLYFSFGEEDVVGIVDVPDSATIAAFSMAVNASGSVALKTTALLTAEEVDAATQKTIAYRAPGQ